MAVARRPGRLRVILTALVVIGMYVAVVLVMVVGGADPDAPDNREPSAAGALVYLDVDAVSGDDFTLQTRASVYPGADLLDSNGDLREALTVEVTPAATASSLEFARGTRLGSQPLSLYADGDIRQWPFDSYRSSRIGVRVFSGTGSARVSVPTEVAVTDSVSSWTVTTRDTDAGPGEVLDVVVERSAATIGFGIAMCVVLAILPICTLFVSIQTLRRRKQFLPPIVTWFAVMLFAVLPIRNLFPGSPPIGSWVDYTVVLWVVMGLALALVLYVAAWWRQGP